MNYLALVNEVLKRLREDTVTSVSQTNYSQLIGAFVNQAKQMVEDRWVWRNLKNYEDFTTTNGQHTYTLSNISNKFQPLQLHNLTSEYEVPLGLVTDIRKKLDFSPESGEPRQFVMGGDNASGNPTIMLYPVPDDAYNMRLYYYQDQDPLTNDSDELLVPWLPVVLAATALALEERGEDTGQSPNTLWAQYEQAIGAAIIRDVKSTAGNYSFDAGQLI